MKKFLKAYVFLGFLCSNLLAQNIKIVDSLYQELIEINQEDDSLKFLIIKGIFLNHPNPDSIVHYSEKGLIIAEKNANPFWIGSCYYSLGIGYMLKGNLGLSLEYLFKSLRIFEQTQNISNQASLHLAIADVYNRQNDKKNASFFYEKAITFLKKENDSLKLAGAYLNYGDLLYNIGEYSLAGHFIDSAFFLYTKLEYKIGLAYARGNLGLVNAQLGDIALAEKNLNNAIKILEEFGDFYPIAVYYISMAEIYWEKGKKNKALHFAQKSFSVSHKNNLKEQIRDASLKLSELYAEMERFDSAYYYHTHYVAYRDSINNEEVIRKMADLRTEYEVSQKQAEIDLLTKEQQLNKLIGWALAFIAFLFGALTFALFRNNRIKQAHNKVLSAQKGQLEKQHLKLEALNHTKDRFFSIISHDLRGPVHAFNGLSELIKHYIARNEMGQLREVSEYIDKSARQLSTMLDNLLDWAIKQQGTFPFHPEKIELTPLLDEVAEMFGITAHAKKIMLSVNVEEDLVLWADRNSLMTIMRNLVNNALKFTEPEGLVTISAYSQNRYAYINVMDTGIGIPEDKLDSLFEIKDRSLSRGTAGEKGLGVGLSLAYEFALMNKGTIIVNSEEKAGTIFTVKIPLPKEQVKDEGQTEVNFKTKVTTDNED